MTTHAQYVCTSLHAGQEELPETQSPFWHHEQPGAPHMTPEWKRSPELAATLAPATGNVVIKYVSRTT